MKKPKISRKAVLIPLLALALTLACLTLIYSLHNSKKTEEFLKKCHELNGKELTYENLKVLNGYIGLGEHYTQKNGQWTGSSYGHYLFDKIYFDKYLKGEFFKDGASNETNFKNGKLIRFGSDNTLSISEYSGVEGMWECRIKPSSSSDPKIIANPNYLIDY